MGNLAAGVTYAAFAVGICADGTRTPPSAPALFTPTSVAAPTPSGDVFLVTNKDAPSDQSVVVCYDAGLSNCEYLGNGGDALFNKPYDILVGGTETWVTNTGSYPGWISVCADKKLTNCVKALGDGTGAFETPKGMAIASTGVYVSSKDGDFVSLCSGPGLTNCVASSTDFFEQPSYILVVGDTVYVANKDTVAVCNTALTSCTKSDGDPTVNFYWPAGMAAAGGKIYVGFSGNIAACTDLDLTVCTITKDVDIGAAAGTDFNGVTVVGDKLYIGSNTDANEVFICNFDLTTCTATNGTGFFNTPTMVRHVPGWLL
jgi:hypothetical protein